MSDFNADTEAEQTAWTPPMVEPSSATSGSKSVRSGSKCELGYRTNESGESLYYLAKRNALGYFSERGATTYPVSRQGWAEAWRAFVGADPEAANAYSAQFQESSASGQGFDAVAGPDGPRGRRSRSYRMIDELAKGRKYRLALDGERFALFSLIGTEDWEDYASLSMTAMELEAILDLDHRVEDLSDQLGRVEGHLARIVTLLEARANESLD